MDDLLQLSSRYNRDTSFALSADPEKLCFGTLLPSGYRTILSIRDSIVTKPDALHAALRTRLQLSQRLSRSATSLLPGGSVEPATTSWPPVVRPVVETRTEGSTLCKPYTISQGYAFGLRRAYHSPEAEGQLHAKPIE